MSSIESWKNQMAYLKEQLSTLKMYKANAMKHYSEIIAAQSNRETKANYRAQKASKKQEWDSKIQYQKQQIATLKANKPSR
jgi:hypothetical protein